MKLVLSFLALALLAWTSTAAVPAFTIDREYIYKQNARIVSGIAGKDMQFTGTGTKSKIIIQNQGKYLYMKLADFKYGEFNEPLHEHDLYEEFKFNYADEKANFGKIVDEYYYPIRFTMERGLIKSFDALPEDPVWSINMKKALLSSFQLNFERVNRVRFSKSNYLNPENHLDFYRVMEDGIGGECETVYHINSEPYFKFPYERVLNVTKNRIFDRCTNRPYFSHSTLIGEKCEGCESTEPLHTTTETEYNIRGDRHYFTIEKIRTVSSYLFTPNTHAQTILVGLNRTLRLEETSPIRDKIVFPDVYVTYNSLAYNFTYKTPYEDVTDLDKPNYYSSYYHWEDNYDELVVKMTEILKHLAMDHDVSVDLEREHIPQDILYMIQALKTMSYDQVKDIFTKLNKDSSESKQKELMRRFFIQVLPLVGTNPTIKAILTLAEKDLVTPREVMELFSTLPLHVKQPSKALIEYFYQVLMKFEKPDTKDEVHTSIWLSFATLLHKGCETTIGLHHTTTYNGFEHKRYVSEEVCRMYNKKIYDMFLKAKTTYEKITFVKALGNVRLEETFSYLKPIITGEVTYPFIVRKYAAAALIEMATDLREEILSLAAPVYYNHTESPFMRIMAFEMIMACKPKYTFLVSLGSHLKSDPSSQVASYVYSTFVAIANSTDPCFEKFSKDLSLVLTIIPEIYYGYDYSRKVMFNYYNDKYAFGGRTIWAWVGSNESFIPENFYIKKTGNAFGHNFDWFEMSVYTHGFHKIYEKIFGPDGLFSPMDTKKSAFNLFRRAPRQVNPVEKELGEIDEKIHFTPRVHDDMEADISIKLYGQDVTFMYLDDVFFNNFIKNDYFNLPRDIPTYLKTNGLQFDFHKIGLDFDMHFELPTEIGIPLVMDIKMPSYTELTGKVKIDVLPGFYAEDREFKKPTHITVDTDLHPLFTTRSFFTFGFRTPLLKKFVTGKDTEIDIHFPIVTKLDYDLTLKKLNFKYTPTTTPYEILHVHTLPYTYSGKYFKIDERDIKSSLKPIGHRDYETDYRVGHNYFGVGLHTHVNASSFMRDFPTFLRTFGVFTTKNTYSFYPDNYYTYWIQRLRNGFEHMADYFFINPNYWSYDIKLMYEPHTTLPTTEFEFEMDFDMYAFKKAFFIDDVSTEMSPVSTMDKKIATLHMELTGKGEVERKWTGNLNVSMSWVGGKTRKVSFDYERSAIPDFDPNPLKMCYRSTTKYPPYTEYYSIDHDDELKAELHYDISFGKECNVKAINVNVVAKKTSEQKYLEEHPSEHLLHLKEACDEHIKQGYNFSDECWELFSEHYNLRKYVIDVEYENLPPRFVNLTTRFANWLRHTYYDEMEYNYIGVDNPENHIKIIANFSSYDSYMDVKVYKPHENIYFKRIYYPYVFPTFQVLNTRINYAKLYLDKLFDYDQSPMCFVQGGKHFSTFDYRKYEFPLSKCYHVLFRDCTDEEKFMVLTKAIEHETYTKVLKVLLGKHKVEILPIGENQNTAPLVVRIDGSKITVTPTTPIVFKDPENDQRILFVVKKQHNWWFLKSKIYGFDIMFNGDAIVSTVSIFHRGHLCGLCGEFNGEIHNDFTGPDGCVYHDESRFGYSYAIPDETCDIPVFKDRGCVQPYAPKYPGKCYYYRNKVVHVETPTDSVVRRPRNVCFSRLPIPHCSEGCKPTDIVKTTVGFHCLSEKDRYTDRMIALSKNEELEFIQSKSEDYEEEVEYPEACVKV